MINATKCELLVDPDTTCGEPVFGDSGRCATHYIQLLEGLAWDLTRDLEDLRAAVRAVVHHVKIFELGSEQKS